MKIFSDINIITPADIEELKTRRVQERTQIDYKQSLLPLNDDNKYELLKDVCAMANSEGGVIIYGAKEDDSSIPDEFPGIEIPSVDDLHNKIDHIIRDNVEERIPGVKHKAILRDDGSYFYIIQVPVSYLAPHMITMATKKSRFYMRINTVSAPMNIQQIKDVALKVGQAEEKASKLIKERFERNSAYYTDSHYLIHIVPLYSNRNAIDLTDYEVTRSLASLEVGSPIHTVHGYLIDNKSTNGRKRVLITRSGAVERIKTPIAYGTHADEEKKLRGRDLETEMYRFFRAVAGHPLSNLAELPALISISLKNIGGTRMTSYDGFPGDILFEEREINPEPIIIYDWSELDSSLKYFFDIFWQSFGMQGSPSFDDNGTYLMP